MQNKCFNCKWFFTCNKSDEKIKNCNWFNETNVKEVIKCQVIKEKGKN